jgi:hypothetical protein
LNRGHCRSDRSGDAQENAVEKLNERLPWAPEAEEFRPLSNSELEDRLSFLNGYLFREMVIMLRTDGPEASGLYSFYEARIEQERSALSRYDRILVKYLFEQRSEARRRIIHAGIGLGTLAASLSFVGFEIAGVESDQKRYFSATRLHNALADACPKAARRYHVIYGEFPAVLKNTAWTDSRPTLVFTNCGGTWSPDLMEETIRLMPSFGDVILDARLFGIVREDPEDRAELVRRIEAQGLRGILIPGMSGLNAFYYHFKAQDVGP